MAGHHRPTDRRTEPRRGLLRPAWDALYRTIRWIAGHVRGFYTALGLYLVLGLGVAALALGAFAWLATQVAEGTIQRVDDAILLWLDARAEPWMDVLVRGITHLGSAAVMWIVLIGATLYFGSTRRYYSVLLLWVAVAGGRLLNSELKAVFDRPRPQLFEWRIPYAGEASFPSGHALTVVVLYGTLAYLIARLEPTRRLRRMTFAVVAAIVVAVGISRLYLGVHYPSDVVAGYVVGLAWATFCALGIEAVRYFRTKKPEVADDERDLEKGVRPLRETMRPEH